MTSPAVRSTRFPQTDYGDHWLWEHRGAGDRRRLAISHIDTVFATGTAKSRPFSISGTRAYGPGVLHASAVAPTLDGFGPQGSRAHSEDEFIEIATLIERAKVTARFIEIWTERFH